MNDIDCFVDAVQNPALREAYALLSRCAPLGRGDCGRLCGGACCEGGEDDGMLLFPFEAELFENKEGFKIIEADSSRKLLVCSGRCERRQRPLGCRLFPLFPLAYEENGETRMRIIRDPRFASCPLNRGEMRLDYSFVRAVRLAGKRLMQDETQKKFLLELSAELADIIALRDKLGVI